jgi:hypothetical protein
MDLYREVEQESNTVAAHVASQFQVSGPVFNVLTACAASTQAVGEATCQIRRAKSMPENTEHVGPIVPSALTFSVPVGVLVGVRVCVGVAVGVEVGDKLVPVGVMVGVGVGVMVGVLVGASPVPVGVGVGGIQAPKKISWVCPGRTRTSQVLPPVVST